MLSLVLSLQVLGIEVHLEMCSLGVDLLNLSHDALNYFLPFFGIHRLHLFFDSLLHLLAVLSLFTNGDFMASHDQGFNVVLQVRLMEAYDVLALSWGNAKINKPVAFIGILIIDDEPMAESVEYDFIEVQGLDLPVADHAWS